MDTGDVYEPVAYTLAAVLGVVIIVIIILMMIAYNRMRMPIEPYPEPEKPPDEMLGYPYPGYKPPEPEPDIILIPPVLAPLPPVDYAVDSPADGGPMPPPDGFVIPVQHDVPPPPPPPPDLKIVKLKRRKKKRRDSSSSESSSSCSDCDSDHGGCHGCHPMSPSMMMLVKPQPVGMTVFSSAPQLAARATEDQTKQAIVTPIQNPCTGTSCF